MPDYKEMYVTIMAATENAINTLIDAQRKAEELYISESKPEIRLFVLLDETNSTRE